MAATTMTLEDARTVLEKLGYKKAPKFTVKQAQEKIDEVLESPDDFEGDAAKIKEKEVKKLIDTIWDAVEDEDEIEVVEEEEEDDEEASDDDDDDDDDDSDEEDEEDEPVKTKKGKKGKASKAESNGKPTKKGKSKRQPPQRHVEKDAFNRSVNSGSHVINVVLERAKGPLTLSEISKAAKTVGKELGIKPRPTIGRYLQRMIRLEQLEADGRGEDRTFVLADGKPRKAKKAKVKDDDDDDTPAKRTGKKGKKSKK